MGIFKTFFSALQVKGEKVKSVGSIVQNDVGTNVFVLRLSDGTKPVDITDYSIITVTVVKPDKTVCIDSTPTDRIEVLDTVNGEISITLHNNAIDIAGICTATVEVYEDDRKMSSARFTYTVIPDLADGAKPTGDASFPVLQNLVSQMSSVLAKETAKVNILDMYDTLAELQSAHPKGTAGDAYAVGDATSSEAYVWSESKGRWVSVGGFAYSRLTLWTNPHPTSEFPAQTLTLANLSAGSVVEIFFRPTASSTLIQKSIRLTRNTPNGEIAINVFNQGALAVLIRTINVDFANNKIEFGGGYWMGKTDPQDVLCIPMEIIVHR